MDARRARWRNRAWMCISPLFSTICACAWLSANPQANQSKPDPREPQEPPQVVDAEREPPAPEEAGDVHSNVLAWIDRVNQVGRDGKRAGAVSASQPGSVTLLSDDEQVPATQPASEDTPTFADLAMGSSGTATVVDPPVLGRVTVRGAPGALAPATDADGPEVNSATFARGGAASLVELLGRLPPPSEDSFREQLDRRMLWVVAGDYEQARAPLHLVTAEQQELASRFVEAWITIRQWHMGDQTGAAAAAARELDELQRALSRLCDLHIPVLKVCSAVRGYGQYDLIDPARFPAGVPSEFVLYSEVSAFVSELDKEGYYSSGFEMRTTILNRAGDTVLELKDANIVDRCRNRRRDCFIPRLVRLPPTLSPGNYVAKVTVIDKLGQKVAEDRVSFQLTARP